MAPGWLFRVKQKMDVVAAAAVDADVDVEDVVVDLNADIDADVLSATFFFMRVEF